MNKITFILILAFYLFFSSCQLNENEKKLVNRIDLFEQIWSTVNEHFYDQKFNGIDWDKKRLEYKTKIEGCDNTNSFILLLNKMLFELNSSHCGVGLVSELDKVVSPYIFSNGEIGIDIRIISNKIIITNVVKNSPADIAQIKTGYIIEKVDNLTLNDIKKLVNYKPPFNIRNKKFHLTSEVLRHIYGNANTTVKISFFDENNQLQTKVLTRTERKNSILLGGGLPPAHLKSESFYISENIAYLSFNVFNASNLEQILSSLEKVNTSKGLIIDLRGNDGGSIEVMKSLLGRFVSKRMKYGAYINRNEQNEDFIEPIGAKYQGKIVLLVDEMSISGAENMAAIVQEFNIGKIIGNQTPGQMLWGNGYLINDSIALVIPIYKLEYISGNNIENKGIIPDIIVEMKLKDLLVGKDTQLERAIEYLNKNL